MKSNFFQSLQKESWEEVKLGEVSANITSGGTPRSNNSEYYGGNIPWLNTKEVKNCRIYSTEKTITDLGFKNSSAKWIEKDSVVVAMYGATAGKVALTRIPLTTNQACCNITLDKTKANENFIYYTLLNMYDELDLLTSGAAQQNLNLSLIENLTIPLPPLKTQEKIAQILSSFDDKIDLLHKQNKTLETLAQTLFRHHFIENAKESWEVGKLGDYVKIELGGTPSTAKSEYWDGDIAWINSGEINKFRIIKPTKYITKLGFQKSNTKLLPKGSVVVAITGATLGQVSLLEIDSCANQSVVGVIPNDEFPSEFLYLWIKSNIDKIILNQTGGAQQHINKNDVSNFEIIKPNIPFLESLNLKTYFAKISHNVREIQNLESLRDIILKKILG